MSRYEMPMLLNKHMKAMKSQIAAMREQDILLRIDQGHQLDYVQRLLAAAIERGASSEEINDLEYEVYVEAEAKRRGADRADFRPF